MVIDIRPLRENLTRVEWLNAIRNAAGMDYQNRIPEATQANITETVRAIFSDSRTRNQAHDALVNRIGLTIYRNISWTNPLAIVKIGMLEFGETIQEIMNGFLEASEYDPDRDELEKEVFGAATPEVQASYHTVNRRNRYKLTVKEPLLRQAFLTEQGLGTFITNLMASAHNSDQYDEYLAMVNLLRVFDEEGKTFVQNVPDVSSQDSDRADSNALLRRLQEFGTLFQFPSRAYNPAGLPVVARPDELLVLTTAQAQAAVNVEALAAAYNMDQLEVKRRTIVLPGADIGIEGFQTAVTTDKFFVVADQRIETTAMQNPAALFTNYWLHHWQVLSASRFAPFVMFNSVRPSTVISLTTINVTAISDIDIVDRYNVTIDDAERGELYNVKAVGITPDGQPDGALEYEVIGANSQFTRISNTGVLYVGPDESAVKLTIKLTSVDKRSITKSIDVDLTGDILTVWPNPSVTEVP